MEYSRNNNSQGMNLNGNNTPQTPLGLAKMVPNALFKSLTEKLHSQIDAMNKEAQRYTATLRRQQDNQFMESIQEHAQSAPQSALSLSSSEQAKTSTSQPENSSTLHTQSMSSKSNSLNNSASSTLTSGALQKRSHVHILHILGLPFGKKKAIVTNESMTMSTVWSLVQKQLVNAELEIRDAKLNGEWDGVNDIEPNASETFTLHIVENEEEHSSEHNTCENVISSENNKANSSKKNSSSTGEYDRNLTSEEGKVIRSASEAAQVHFRSLPANVHVQVSYAGSTRSTVVPHEAEINHAHNDNVHNHKKESLHDVHSVNTNSNNNTTSSTINNQSDTQTESELLKECISENKERKETDKHATEDTLCAKMESDNVEEKRKEEVIRRESNTTTTTTALEVDKATESDDTNDKTSVNHSKSTNLAPITVKCTLPDGRSKMIEQLEPSSDTIASKIRPVITDMLNHNHFVFVQAYPPRRLAVDTDEVKPLCELGMRGPSLLRVVLTEQETKPPSSTLPTQQTRGSFLHNLFARTSAASTQPSSNFTTSGMGQTPSSLASPPPHTSVHVDPMVNLSSNSNNNNNNNNNSSSAINNDTAASQTKFDPAVMMQYFSRIFGNNNNQQANFPSEGSRGAHVTGDPFPHRLHQEGRSFGNRPGRQTGGFRSMAEMVDANNEEEEENAKDELRREEILRALQTQFREQFQLNNNNNNNNNNSSSNTERQEGRTTNKHAKPAKKSNRYYGGSSTEIIAPADNDDDDDNDSDDADADANDDNHNDHSTEGSNRQSQMPVPFAGVGRRLAEAPKPKEDENVTSKPDTKDGEPKSN